MRDDVDDGIKPGNCEQFNANPAVNEHLWAA